MDTFFMLALAETLFPQNDCFVSYECMHLFASKRMTSLSLLLFEGQQWCRRHEVH